MRTVSAEMTAAWKAQAKTGSNQRPTVRATIQVAHLHSFDYDTATAPGGEKTKERHRAGVFGSVIFGEDSGLRELRNIKTCTWTRNLDQDVAECTLTLLNTDLTPIGNAAELDPNGDFDQLGRMTYNRGDSTVEPNPWGYDTETGWNGALVPDRLVRTYEGYGFDYNVAPALDPHLMQSGTWLIDDVLYTSSGEIEIKMRDVGRLLLDQIVFPPVIPYSEYPLSWSKIHTENVAGRDVTGGAWTRPKGSTNSSNDAYIGKGLVDPPFPSYVTGNGGVNGHHASHALTDRDGEWWWSTGQTTPSSKVWWEVDLKDATTALAGIRIHPHGGPYRVYISLKGPNGWIGKRKIPYTVTTEGIDVKADIPFVKSMTADKGLPFDVILPRRYNAIERVRITFGRLQDTKVGAYPFRAGLNDIELYTAKQASDLGFKAGKVLKVIGNYADFTDIVKWCCAWAGFYWPPHSTGGDFVRVGDGQTQTITYVSADNVLPKGRVWGDFMNSGTAGEAPLSSELFDKKPLLDVINYIRDLLGFIFGVDETGGIIWRMPNLWELGNYLAPGDLNPRGRGRTSSIVVIDERETLLDYSTRLSSKSIRERLFVANTTGKVGTVIKGFVPYYTGFRRVAGWTDQHFETKEETRVMADMVAARSMFGYKTGRVTIPGYPAIQIDDQVRIFERVTNETFYHHVLGISSVLDMAEGTWTYDLDIHWLGERPSDAWVVDPTKLGAVTQAYLGTL